LEPIESAYELENLLKERYGVGGQGKRAKLAAGPAPPLPRAAPPPRQPPAQPRDQLQQRQQAAVAQALAGGGGDLGAGKGKGMARQPSKELASLDYISAGLMETLAGTAPALDNPPAEAPALAQPPGPQVAAPHSPTQGEEQKLEHQPQTQSQEETALQEDVKQAPPPAAAAPPLSAPAALAPQPAPALEVHPHSAMLVDAFPLDPAAAAAALAAGAAAAPGGGAAAAEGSAAAFLVPGTLGEFSALQVPMPMPGGSQTPQEQLAMYNALAAGLPGFGAFPAMMPGWPQMLASMPWMAAAAPTGSAQPAGPPALFNPPGAGAAGGSARADAAAAGAPAAGAAAASPSKPGEPKSFALGDRPGRPPSYDEMVRWCVGLKRMLWQRHVPLTIEVSAARTARGSRRGRRAAARYFLVSSAPAPAPAPAPALSHAPSHPLALSTRPPPVPLGMRRRRRWPWPTTPRTPAAPRPARATQRPRSWWPPPCASACWASSASPGPRWPPTWTPAPTSRSPTPPWPLPWRRS
jgi:hypothetical protein